MNLSLYFKVGGWVIMARPKGLETIGFDVPKYVLKSILGLHEL